jgi:hypothetical protein
LLWGAGTEAHLRRAPRPKRGADGAGPDHAPREPRHGGAA